MSVSNDCEEEASSKVEVMQQCWRSALLQRKQWKCSGHLLEAHSLFMQLPPSIGEDIVNYKWHLHVREAV